MSFSLQQSFATDDVDLGSAHRAVYCLLDLPQHAKQKTKNGNSKQKKHWKPTVDENGTPVLYHNILNQALEQKKSYNFSGY